MYKFLKKYRLTINVFIAILLIALLLLKMKGVAISYSLFVFLALGGVLFNHLLVSYSKKERKA